MPELPTHRNYDLVNMGFTDGSLGKEFACNAGYTGDVGLISGLRSSPGGGNGNPLQYFCLKNPMDREAWWSIVQRVTKSQTQLSTHTHTHTHTHSYLLSALYSLM